MDIARVDNSHDICEILEHYTREDSTSKLTEVSNVIHGLVYMYTTMYNTVEPLIVDPPR